MDPAAVERTDIDPVTWAITAARAADDKLAQHTIIVDVGDVLAITGHFVITAGANTRQVKAIAENVEEQIVAAGGPKPTRIEGLGSLEWVLLDYGDFVVHVFLEETRLYYELERLWGDRPQVAWRE